MFLGKKESMQKIIQLISIIGLFFSFINVCFADTIDTQLSNDRITMGETLTVTFLLNQVGTTAKPDFSPLSKDFNIIGTNYGSSINVLNGATSGQIFWQVVLEPKFEGELIVPEINFGNLKSKARKLFVADTPKTFSVKSNQKNIDAFVQADLDTTSPYIESQAIYTFKLFSRIHLENPRIEMPEIKDVIFMQIGNDKTYHSIVKGEEYFVYEKKLALFSQNDGEMIIPPIRFHATEIDTHFNLLDDAFSMPQAKLINLKTQSFKLHVKKMPVTYAGDTWLPAKNITLTERWQPDLQQWEEGKPVTRTITIEAQGLRSDQIPDLTIENIAGINIYAEPPKRTNRFQKDTLIGTWQQKITYIPNSSQMISIPAIKLNWWNTLTNQNANSQLNAIGFKVLENPSKISFNTTHNTLSNSNSKIPGQTKQQTLLSTSINDAYSGNTNSPPILSNKKSVPFYSSVWFWIACLLFITWCVTIVWFYKLRLNQQKKLMQSPTNSKKRITLITQFDEKILAKACNQGDTAMAQKLLLLWANTNFESVTSLGKLQDLITDKNFKDALKDLEMSIYSEKTAPWDGVPLLKAFLETQKQKRFGNQLRRKRILVDKKKTQFSDSDILPPLYP